MHTGCLWVSRKNCIIPQNWDNSFKHPLFYSANLSWQLETPGKTPGHFWMSELIILSNVSIFLASLLFRFFACLFISIKNDFLVPPFVACKQLLLLIKYHLTAQIQHWLDLVPSLYFFFCQESTILTAIRQFIKFSRSLQWHPLSHL